VAINQLSVNEKKLVFDISEMAKTVFKTLMVAVQLQFFFSIYV